jgi:hypothetical protein
VIGVALVIAPFTLLTFFAPIAPLLICLTIPVYNEWKRVNQFKQEVPEGSRFNGASSNLALLRAIPHPIECPNCDGNIDLSTVKEDMIYHCEYCGASGKVEILKTEN